MGITKVNIQSNQDVPPANGYPKINSTRGARHRGPTGLAIWLTVIGMTAYGFYKIGETSQEKRSWYKEKREQRMAVVPFLQAEIDRGLTIQYAEEKALEAEIMKNRPDWEVGKPQYSKRWTYPRVFLKKPDYDDRW